MAAKNTTTKNLYFVTTTVVNWVDIFSRPKYKHIIIESLAFCQKNKGLEIYSWVLMPNHLHFIIGAENLEQVQTVLRDFKKFTSKKIIAELLEDIQESRREWMLQLFKQAGEKNQKISMYHFWQDGCYTEVISSLKFFKQKLDYIHQNPVRAEFVRYPQDYLYSSAIDYAGSKGLLEVIVVR